MWGARSGIVIEWLGLWAPVRQCTAGRSEAKPFRPSPDFPPGKGGDQVNFTGTSQEPNIKVEFYWHGIFKGI